MGDRFPEELFKAMHDVFEDYKDKFITALDEEKFSQEGLWHASKLMLLNHIAFSCSLLDFADAKEAIGEMTLIMMQGIYKWDQCIEENQHEYH